MKIKQFELIDRCLFWKDEKILVVGDLHLGYENLLMEQGVSFPKSQMVETVGLFKKIFEKTRKLKKIILLGDVKHYFGGILNEEFGDVGKLINLFEKNLLASGKVIITKGNHDVILEPVIRNFEFVKLVDYFIWKEVLFSHGVEKEFDKIDRKFFDSVNLVVVGHFHPAIIVSNDSKKEKYKCFLFGKNKELKKEMIFVPSFFPLVEGSDIVSQIKWIWNVKNFEVFVLSGKFGEVLDFGKLKNL